MLLDDRWLRLAVIDSLQQPVSGVDAPAHQLAGSWHRRLVRPVPPSDGSPLVQSVATALCRRAWVRTPALIVSVRCIGY